MGIDEENPEAAVGVYRQSRVKPPPIDIPLGQGSPLSASKITTSVAFTPVLLSMTEGFPGFPSMAFKGRRGQEVCPIMSHNDITLLVPMVRLVSIFGDWPGGL